MRDKKSAKSSGAHKDEGLMIPAFKELTTHLPPKHNRCLYIRDGSYNSGIYKHRNKEEIRVTIHDSAS